MKAGDKVWAPVTVDVIAGTQWGTGDRQFTQGDEIPHTEALPAVARWLAEHEVNIEALRSGLSVLTAYRGRQTDGEKRLTALLAALTTEEA